MDFQVTVFDSYDFRHSDIPQVTLVPRSQTCKKLGQSLWGAESGIEKI
jgi:hypothetical protein